MLFFDGASKDNPFSLSEFGFSRSDLVCISDSDYLFSGSLESFFCGFKVLVLSILGHVGFLALWNCEICESLVAFFVNIFGVTT